MKTKILLKSVFSLFLAASFLVSCVTDSTTESNYIKLSDGGFSFLGDGNEPKVVEVTSNLPWEAKSLDESWLKISEKSENSITIIVEDNETGFERASKIVVTAGGITKEVAVNQVQKESALARYRTLENQFQNGAVMSPNGRYIGGFYATMDESETSFVMHPIVIDIETDEWHEFGPYPYDLLMLYSPLVMSDQGILFLYDELQNAIGFDIRDDEYFVVKGDATIGDNSPCVQGVSADGSIWVGDTMIGGFYKPVKWVNEVSEILPEPELSYRNEEFVTGILARGISADGSIIYGTTWDNLDFGMLYWDKQGNVDYVGERKFNKVYMDDGEGGKTREFTAVDGMTCTASNTQVSATGKYIAGTYRTEKLGGDGSSIDSQHFAGFFDTETKELIVFEDLGDATAIAVTDEGIGFVGIPAAMCSRGVVVDVKNKTVLGTMREWVFATYGLHVPEGFIKYMTPDMDVFMGLSIFDGAMMPENSYWYVAPPLKK